MSTFNHPSEFTEPASVLGSTLRDDGFDTAVAKGLTMGFGVVAAIGVNSLGLLKDSTDSAVTMNRFVMSHLIRSVILWDQRLRPQRVPITKLVFRHAENQLGLNTEENRRSNVILRTDICRARCNEENIVPLYERDVISSAHWLPLTFTGCFPRL